MPPNASPKAAADGQLVGLDAEALGVQAELVPVSWSKLTTVTADDLTDLMPGVWCRPYWFSALRLSEPYHVGTMGILVHDERRHEFASVETLRRSEGLRIGVPLDASSVAATCSTSTCAASIRRGRTAVGATTVA